ncbi:hypothetical protein BC936DRAFT_141188 [Jimgerdemannia flammicorona]|uniref:Uncharacterized protein n=1 Tax=Jimgerdemannia flammicorona TaxID=994334 RepID=A0A433A2R4_9FUNG|nr:hypothetical protein BC936DRAFT_141188 [Jimgerdemannia flammicorona]
MSLFPFMNPVAYTTTNGHPISDIDDIDDDPEASGAFLSPPGENGSRGAGEQRKSYASVFFGSREPTRNKGPQHGYERMAQSAVTRPRRTSSPTPRSNGSLGNEYHSYYSDPAGSNSPTEPVLSSAFDFINPSGVSNPKGSRKQHEEYRVDSRSAQSSAFSFIESPQPQTSLGELAFAIPPSTSTTARLATTANSIILSSPPLTATHPAPTPPPLPRASVDNSRRLIAETRLKQTRSEIYRLTDYQARLFARRDVVREQLTERLKRAHELDAEQARALEKEDFAMAERVAAQVEEVRGAVEKLRTMLPDSDKRVREAGERVVDMMRRSVESARGTASECAALREERERSLHQFESDAQQMNGKQTDRISAEREEVERARSEVVSELEIWERNDAKCQERIDELIHDERAERDQHLAKRDAVRVCVLCLL